jgi:hypothetical protein
VSGDFGLTGDVGLTGDFGLTGDPALTGDLGLAGDWGVPAVAGVDGLSAAERGVLGLAGLTVGPSAVSVLGALAADGSPPAPGLAAATTTPRSVMVWSRTEGPARAARGARAKAVAVPPTTTQDFLEIDMVLLHRPAVRPPGEPDERSLIRPLVRRPG